MFFYNLLNNHYWILVFILVFIGSLPIASMGLMLIRDKNKKGYIYICISLFCIILSLFNFVREKYLSILVVFLVLTSIAANIYFKRIYVNNDKE